MLCWGGNVRDIFEYESRSGQRCADGRFFSLSEYIATLISFPETQDGTLANRLS